MFLDMTVYARGIRAHGKTHRGMWRPEWTEPFQGDPYVYADVCVSIRWSDSVMVVSGLDVGSLP